MKNSKQEIWRDIPDYEGYYQVSNEGRVRSLDRWVIYKNGRKRFYKGRFFEGSLNNGGYKRLMLSKDGKSEHFLIHQLIAVCFLNHTPDGHTLVVDHIDGDKLNNKAENLQIVTNRDNTTTCHRKDRNILSSKFVGVTFHKNCQKWMCQPTINGKQTYLGYHPSEEEAHQAILEYEAIQPIVKNS